MEFHGDIPDNVREQLYAEERQRLLKQNKSTNSVAPGSTLLQINIIVLLSQLSQPAGSSSRTSEPAPNLIGDDLNDVPGLLEAAVGEYGTWHPSRVGTENYRDNIRKARDIALEQCFDIVQICEES